MGLIRYADGDIVNDTQRVATSTWTNNTNKLLTANMHESPIQNVNNIGTAGATVLGSHFINLYFNNTVSGSEMAVAYGHIAGSGSLDYTNGAGGNGFSPSRVIYNQYRQLVYGDEASKFTFNGYVPDHIYVINVNRARYKHNLKPGSMMLTLNSTVTKTYTDDSITTSGSATLTNAGRQFNVVEGTTPGVMTPSANGLNQSTNNNKGCYGLFYPDSGFIILNPDALVDEGHTALTPTTTANWANNDNHQKLVDAMQLGSSFILDSEEKISSQFYFTRARNSEFNYTTNPSFVDINGSVNVTSMIDNPTTYITTVGMYNDSGDLVAVAKLSQPVTKDFTKEALIRVKLDY